MRVTGMAAGADRIELRIIGYQFPDAEPDGADDWDANWLMIEGEVTAAGSQWRFRDPCLTTWEARALLDWLRRAPNSDDAIDFVEPALAFAREPAEGGGVTIAVTLGDGATPAADDAPASDPVRLTIPLTRAQLDSAAAEWERELAAHPAR